MNAASLSHNAPREFEGDLSAVELSAGAATRGAQAPAQPRLPVGGFGELGIYAK